MSERGRSLSMFVVQRTFTRVRRGYDPAEVDRHLELVRDWFTSSEVGRAVSEERSRLEQRENAIVAREQALEQELRGARVEADGILEGAARRAEAQLREADKVLQEARTEAARILDAARLEAAAADIVAKARREAERIVGEAHAAAAAEAAELRVKLQKEAEAEADAYVDRRKREADRLVRAARRAS